LSCELNYNQIMKIYKTPADLAATEIRALYAGLAAPIAALDCGQECAQHNPHGKPFCCDICHAVPAAYTSEWAYLEKNTNLWHKWRGAECAESNGAADQARLAEETPASMLLLACLGPAHCQRDFRALSCRQFPFFPYVTADYRFLGLAYDWEFEPICWVISNLAQVTDEYRHQFIQTFDRLFALFQDEFDSYALRAEQMRAYFVAHKRRIPILHRDGGFYLLSPGSERLRRVDSARLPHFGPY
jgi:hypothetical protein